MAYDEKTDWLPDDPINEDDVNRWEKGIKDAHTDLAAHKNDMNNPHNTTKAQIGLGNVDNVQQAAKKDFDQHEQDQVRHITKDERVTWNNAQLSKLTNNDGSVLIKIEQGYDFHSVATTQRTTFTFYTSKEGINTPPQSTRGIYLYSSPTSGEAIALSNDRGLWRKSLVGGTWSDWVKYETEEGAQKKVNSHEEKVEIHVTQEDKDKWNKSQLSKISGDDGQPLFNLTTDFHTELQNYPTLTYFSYEKTAANAPPSGGRGIWMCSAGRTYGHVIVMTNDNRTFRKSLANNVWTDWLELETTDGAQKKVDEHAKNSKVHITSAERSKWDAAQLTKLTRDDGKRTRIPDGTDILSLPTGFYYGAGTTMINSPADGDGSWFNYDVIEGDSGRKSIFASRGYDNTLWFGSVHTDGVFKGWNKLETETGSQNKADKALSDAKSFVQANYSNEKLTVLTGVNAITDARIGGNDYPKGITIMDIGQGNTTGYPLGYGIVKNEKYHDYRFTQYFHGTGNESNSYFDSTGTWIRHWWNGSGWTAWQKISGFAHVNIGTTGKQLLIKGEKQKICFNRKIKDSHNAFDINNYRFICPNSGMFLINAGVYIQNVQRYSNYELEIYLNGKIYKNIAHYRNSPASPSDTTDFNVGVYGAATVPADAGDYIEMYLYVGYDGDTSRYISDSSGWYNYFDITEIGGRNYPRF